MHSFGNHKHVLLLANIKCSDVQDEQLNDMVSVPNWALVLPNLLFLVRYNWALRSGLNFKASL